MVFAWLDLAYVIYNSRSGTIYRPYIVTDEQSKLTDYLLLQSNLATVQEINLHLITQIDLPVSRTLCVQPSEGATEECRRMGDCFHCAINFEPNYLNS